MRRYTYRADDSVAEKLDAMKSEYGISFQRLCDDTIKELLYKLRTESTMFHDLTITKKIEYTVRDIVNSPGLRFWNKRP